MFLKEIEHVVYINLDERIDRREEVENELEIFGNRVERFRAIRNTKNGGLGCSASHLSVLKAAKELGWSNVLICEDDFMWKNKEQIESVLNPILKNSYNVILFGATCVKFCNNASGFEAQSAVGYLVHGSYFDTLIRNFEEGFNKLSETNNSPLYAIDQYWKHLQKKDKWTLINPGLVVQRPSYSDIENRQVNYLNSCI